MSPLIKIMTTKKGKIISSGLRMRVHRENPLHFKCIMFRNTGIGK